MIYRFARARNDKSNRAYPLSQSQPYRLCRRCRLCRLCLFLLSCLAGHLLLPSAPRRRSGNRPRCIRWQDAAVRRRCTDARTNLRCASADAALVGHGRRPGTDLAPRARPRRCGTDLGRDRAAPAYQLEHDPACHHAEEGSARMFPGTACRAHPGETKRPANDRCERNQSVRRHPLARVHRKPRGPASHR